MLRLASNLPAQVLVLKPRSILNRLELAVSTLSRSTLDPPALESTSTVTPARYKYKVLRLVNGSCSYHFRAQLGSIFSKIIPENFGLTIDWRYNSQCNIVHFHCYYLGYRWYSMIMVGFIFHSQERYLCDTYLFQHIPSYFNTFNIFL